jgi:hypothetical protein
MRTTVRLDPRLLTEVKKMAAGTGRTLTAVIEDALRAALAARRQARGPRDVHLTIVDGHGVRPGIDLDDTSALVDVMDPGRGPA